MRGEEVRKVVREREAPLSTGWEEKFEAGHRFKICLSGSSYRGA